MGVSAARWYGVVRRGCRVALVYALLLKHLGLSGVVSFLCVVPPRSRFGSAVCEVELGLIHPYDTKTIAVGRSVQK
jgi:hypothetical protein